MRNYNLISVFLGIVAVFVLGVTLMQLRVVLMPFVLAMLLSVIFKPLVIGLKARRFPTALSLLLVLIAFFLVLFLLGWFLTSSIGSFAQEIPRYEARATAYLNNVEAWAILRLAEFRIEVADINWSRAINLSSITTVISTGIGTFISFLGTAFLVLLFMMFILAGSGDLAEKVKRAFPEGHAERIATVISNVDAQLRRYLITKTLISFLTGLITGLVVAAFGVDFPFVWGFLAFVLNYIPNFGSLVAVVFPVILSLLQFDSVGLTLSLMVLLVSMQAVLGNYIEPRLMGFRLNLSPLFILVCLIFWGWLWGFWGLVLAVPLTAGVKIVFENVDVLHPVSILMSGWTEGPEEESTPDEETATQPRSVRIA